MSRRQSEGAGLGEAYLPGVGLAIEARGVAAGYGAATVLHGIDLDVAPGEFVALLGSSGCGKTTLLRSIAGFQKIRAGAIRLFGADAAHLPPEKRGLAMVFQSYALWPHMTVAGNIGYGLRLRGVGRTQTRAKIDNLLALLGLEGLAERKVTDLSGGQRQRVALGRALAIDPPLLLLDEPLSNLDAKVRLSLRHEIKALQRKLGFAALHVTHDREEAMTMADRIVIMEKGRIAQMGAPEAIYDRPASPFVASFMGAENTITLSVEGQDGALRVRARDGGSEALWRGDVPRGQAVAYFRDDAARLCAPDERRDGEIVLPGRIATRAYPGGRYRYGVDVGGRLFSAMDERALEPGAAVGFALPLGALHIFPQSDDHAI